MIENDSGTWQGCLNTGGPVEGKGSKLSTYLLTSDLVFLPENERSMLIGEHMNSRRMKKIIASRMNLCQNYLA